MMIIENILGHPKVQIRWQHFLSEEGVRVTRCHIEALGTDSKLPIGYGFAHCSHKDNFCKNTGRKLSLQRATHSMPKEVKEAIWMKYLKMRHGRW
jgi:hypothetical protein